jgi:hypothetical protein
MKLEKSQACPWSNLGPRTGGPVGLKAGGVARADRCPAIGQPGPEAWLWQTEAGFGKLSLNFRVFK